MKRLLRPNLEVGNLKEIPLDVLAKKNIRGIIFDLDNTIIAWDKREMEQEIIEWLRLLQAKGFKLCIVSNSMKKRVRIIAESLAFPYAARAGKPLRRGFRKALELLSLEGDEVAVVGDQLFTDVLGGNRIGAFTILVRPLGQKEFFTTRCMRILEGLVFKRKK